MSRAQAIAFVWREVEYVDADGEVIRTGGMVPATRYRNVAERQFGAGGEYVLEEATERSMASHSHYFATLNELFHNMPEKIAPRFPTAEHLRKWCLCETGYFDEKEFDLLSEKHAKALCTFVRVNDRYARISQHGNKVIVRTAKSQSLKAMGKEEFQRSKDDVMSLASELVGVSKTEATKNAGRAS